jgi:hypothetical protein
MFIVILLTPVTHRCKAALYPGIRQRGTVRLYDKSVRHERILLQNHLTGIIQAPLPAGFPDNLSLQAFSADASLEYIGLPEQLIPP